MYKLRYYQEEAVQIALDSFNKNRPFIIQAATGAGKSLIIAEICHRLDEPVLILQPSKELLEQNHAKLLDYGISDIGIYSASKNLRQIAKFTYATIGSIYKVPDLFKHFQFVIVDECDLVNPKALAGMYQQFFNAIGCKCICGLTATPYRTVQKYFTDFNGMLCSTAFLSMITRIGYPTFWSGGIVYKIETKELIDTGYLAPINYHITEVGDSDLVINSTGAEYTTDSLEIFWNDRRIKAMSEILKDIDRKCNRNLIFCSSLRQASRTQHMMQEGGIKCEMVTSFTSKKDRERIVQDFREGRVKHLVNMGVFTVGFDIPELDSIVMARPTMSLRLYYQCLGRGLRLDPNNPYKVLHFHDVAGVVERLGTVESIRIVKEDDGFKDRVVSSAGEMTGKPLFTYQLPKKVKEKK